MVFSSLEFIFIFLPVFLVIYFVLPKIWRNFWIFVGSVGFYAYGTLDKPQYILLLLMAVLVNFLMGKAIERSRGSGKLPLTIGIVYNLAWLCVFKYSDFIFENINILSENFGGSGELLEPWNLLLPVGISFYTFQSISYLMDVYRREIQAERSFANFGAYLTMFPQLIAGPIVKYREIKEEMIRRKSSFAQFDEGLRIFTLGLGMKVLLANRIGSLWSDIQAVGFESISTPVAWMGIFAFSFQLYFDFYGYSMMAIGLGRIMGFTIPQNFDHPYQSLSMTEFWRRWHMSLSSFFRDYVYIPLGGNRCGKIRQCVNILIVWALTGFWHGASWNFILWGLYFAAWLILERYVLRGVLEKTPAILKHLYTLIVVFVGWGLFAMVDLGVCGDYLAACFGGAPLWSGADLFRLRSYAVTLAVLVLASTALGQRLWAKLPRQAEQLATPVLMGLSLVVCTAYLVDGSYNPFLYFRF